MVKPQDVLPDKLRKVPSQFDGKKMIKEVMANLAKIEKMAAEHQKQKRSAPEFDILACFSPEKAKQLRE